MRVRYQLAISLDGFIAPADGSHEWLDPYGELAMAMLEPFMQEVGGLVMGRLTYEQLRSFGPGPFDETPTVVLTSNPDLPVHAAGQVCTDGPAAALDAIRPKLAGKDVWLFGGGATATGFLEADLIDLVELTTVPVVLGDGRPLFPGAASPVTLERVSCVPGEMGTVSTTYARITPAPTPGARSESPPE